MNTNQAGSSSIFGSSAAATNTNQAGLSSIFGSTATKNNNQAGSSSIFGSSTPAKNTNQAELSSVFGSSTAATNTNQEESSSFFGSSTVAKNTNQAYMFSIPSTTAPGTESSKATFREFRFGPTQTVGTSQASGAVNASSVFGVKFTDPMNQSLWLYKAPSELESPVSIKHSSGMDLPEETLTTLICDQCGNYLSIFPIYLNGNGKQICGRCPKGSEDAKHELLYEKVAKLINFPCKNKQFGCGQVLTPDKMKEHESECCYESWECLECEWKGLLSKFREHYYHSHPDSVITEEKYLDYSFVGDDKHLRILLDSKEDLFLVNLYKNGSELRASVQLIDGSDTFENYKYELNLLCDSTGNVVKVPQEAVQKFDFDVKTCKISLNGIDLNQICSLNVKVVNQYRPILSKPDDLILKLLECITCLKYMRGNIYQCPRGHVLCECVSHNSYCNQCKCKLKGVASNFAIQIVAKNINYPCKNEGCDVISSFTQYGEHFIKCKYKMYKCIKCDFQSKFHILIEHMESNHNTDVFKDKFKTTNDFRSDNESVIIKSDSVYIVHQYSRGTIYTIDVKYFGPLYKPNDFSFELNMENANGEKMMTRTKRWIQFPDVMIDWWCRNKCSYEIKIIEDFDTKVSGSMKLKGDT